MSGSKLQIAMVAGLIVTAGMALQAGIPRLTNDASLLYLRAQYKLARGDAGSALQLMQQAAGPQRQATPAPSTATKCARPAAPPKSQVRTVSLRSAKTTRVHSTPLTFDRTWVVEHSRMIAQLKASQAERERDLQATMARVHEQLKGLPVPVNLPAMTVPAASVTLQ